MPFELERPRSSAESPSNIWGGLPSFAGVEGLPRPDPRAAGPESRLIPAVVTGDRGRVVRGGQNSAGTSSATGSGKNMIAHHHGGKYCLCTPASVSASEKGAAVVPARRISALFHSPTIHFCGPIPLSTRGQSCTCLAGLSDLGYGLACTSSRIFSSGLGANHPPLQRWARADFHRSRFFATADTRPSYLATAIRPEQALSRDQLAFVAKIFSLTASNSVHEMTALLPHTVI